MPELCESVGPLVEWSRFVQPGHWETGLDAHDKRAKPGDPPVITHIVTVPGPENRNESTVTKMPL